MKFNVLTGVLILALIGLGAYTYKKQNELSTLRRQIDSQSMPIESSTGSESLSSAVIAERTVVGKDQPIAFQYRCSGESKKGLETVGDSGEILSYCVGDYALVAIVGGQSTEITSGHAVDGYDSPVLLKAESFGEKGDVLISFKPSCASTLDCGAGMPTNEVTHLFRSEGSEALAISNFPPRGIPVWNSLGTKALFIMDTCGGAGCSMSPIIGYAFDGDRAVDLTNERAVGLSEEMTAKDATDVMGDRLPVWKSVAWDVGDTFTAVMTDSDGNQKQIKGTF